MANVEDMTNLDSFTEETVLGNLRRRYMRDQIYTYTGNILVALNPYEEIPSMYNNKVAEMYFNKRLQSLPPHIFAMADAAYHGLLKFQQSQSLIISGESGAGKTESTKLILQYLSSLKDSHSAVEQMVLESSPILEAFGNAKTVRNNNSSRFGKFMKVYFSETGVICGATLHQYLLEKARITSRSAKERSYHIFYHMLAGMSQQQRDEFGLTRAEDYKYLSHSNCLPVPGVDDGQSFNRVQMALRFLDIGTAKQQNIWRVLAAVLKIGNVDLIAARTNGSSVRNPKELESVANLLQINSAQLTHAFLNRVTQIKGDKIAIPLKPGEALDNRDALARFIYQRLFEWIVAFINSTLGSSSGYFIGVLDIFGFEQFEINSFEQFCINYTNEKLQQYFVDHVFRLEQEEYRKEGVEWANVEYKDHHECLNLIEKKIGILALIDEEVRFPNGTDGSLLEKLSSRLSDNPKFEIPKRIPSAFIVKHYAGDVPYSVDGFLSKNRDTLQPELQELLQSSSNSFISEIFRMEDHDTQTKSTKSTLASQFKTQLASLMEILRSTTPYHVLCLKPNSQMKPKIFEDTLVRTQLNYVGMLGVIEIRRLGYSYRFPINEFCARFNILANRFGSGQKASRDGATQILQSSTLADSTWKVGPTKVFLKEITSLEEQRDKLVFKLIARVQATWKMYTLRKEFLTWKAGAAKIYTFAKMVPFRVRFKRERDASIVLQSIIRMLPCAKKLKFLKKEKEEDDMERLLIDAELSKRLELELEAILEETTGNRLEVEDKDTPQEAPPMKYEDIIPVNHEEKTLEMGEGQDIPQEQEQPPIKAIPQQFVQPQQLPQPEESVKPPIMPIVEDYEFQPPTPPLDESIMDIAYNSEATQEIQEVSDREPRVTRKRFLTLDANSQLLETAMCGALSTLDIILKGKVDINYADNTGFTALHWGVYANKVQVIERLLKEPPIQVNQQDHLGFTPLHYAAANNSKDIILLLKQRSELDLTIQNMKGLRAVDLATVVEVMLLIGGKLENSDDEGEGKERARRGTSLGSSDSSDSEEEQPRVAIVEEEKPVISTNRTHKFVPPAAPTKKTAQKVKKEQKKTQKVVKKESTMRKEKRPSKNRGSSETLRKIQKVRKVWENDAMRPFVEQHFRKSGVLKMGTILGKPKTRDFHMGDRVAWTNEPIFDALLLTLNNPMNILATELFGAILHYMGEHPKFKQDAPIEVVQTLVKHGMNLPDIRDEIFCQLYKQTNGNPCKSVIKGWALIALCCGCFSPSETLFPCFENYLKAASKGIGTKQNLASYSLHLLSKNKKSKLLREYPPSCIEIEAVERAILGMPNKMIPLRVNLMDKSTSTIYIDATTTVKEALGDIVKRCRLESGFGWALCEVSPEREVFLRDAVNVCDLLAAWEMVPIGRKSNVDVIVDPSNSSFIPVVPALSGTPELFLKKKFYTELELSADDDIPDPVAVHLLYHQANAEVIGGIVPVTREGAILLAALQLQVSGTMNAFTNKPEDYLESVLPAKLVELYERENFVEPIIDVWKHLAQGQTDCKHQYLTALKIDNKYYGRAMYDCEITFNNQSTFRKVFIGHKHFLVTESKYPYKIVHTWEYSQVTSWSASGHVFSANVGSMLKPDRCILVTPQVEELSEVFQSYNLLSNPNTTKTSVAQARTRSAINIKDLHAKSMA